MTSNFNTSDLLTRLAIFYGTDKAQHGFSNFYHKHFEPFRNRFNVVAEIGIHAGGSLLMWREYFSTAKIYGMDISPPQLPPLDRIYTFTGDQSKRDDLEAFKQTVNGPVDLLVDDGGHTMEQQQISLGNLFSSISEGGYYVIEDLHTSFSENINLYQNGKLTRSYPTGINDCRYTSYEFVTSLKNSNVLDSEYITGQERQYLETWVSEVLIFDRDNDNKHITALIKKGTK